MSSGEKGWYANARATIASQKQKSSVKHSGSESAIDTRASQKASRRAFQKRLLASAAKRAGTAAGSKRQFKKRVLALDLLEEKKQYGLKVDQRYHENRRLLKNKFVKKSQQAGGIKFLFDWMDENKAGKISLKMFCRGLGRLGWSMLVDNHEHVQLIFQGIDQDGDGYLQLEELANFVGQLSEESTSSPMRMETSKSTTNFSRKAPSTNSLRRQHWEEARGQNTEDMFTSRIGSRPERVGTVSNHMPIARFHSLYQVQELPQLKVLPPLRTTRVS
jgi:hypothetical protein